MKNIPILLCAVFVTTLSCTKITTNDFSSVTNIAGDSINIKINIAPPTINFSFIDSSKTIVQVHVAGSTIQQGDIFVSVKDSITINNSTNNNNSFYNSFFNTFNNSWAITNNDSIIINNNLVNQINCPYTQCKCIVANCNVHSHKCMHHMDKDCGDDKCIKHHSKCN